MSLQHVVQRNDKGWLAQNSVSKKMLLSELHVHPFNTEIYGSETPPDDLVRSMEKVGQLNPIIVARFGRSRDSHGTFARDIRKQDGTYEIVPHEGQVPYHPIKYLILSGSRRFEAAKLLGWAEIEVVAIRGDNPSELEARRIIIESNAQREKTPEQKAREYKELKRIESELAKQRQKTLNNAGGKISTSEVGKARDKAAEAVGISGRTAEKLEKVVDAADAGNAEAREALDAINHGKMSVAAAHEKIHPKSGTCPACGDSFPSQNQLKKHAETVHHIGGADFRAFLRGTFTSPEPAPAPAEPFEPRESPSKKPSPSIDPTDTKPLEYLFDAASYRASGAVVSVSTEQFRPPLTYRLVLRSLSAEQIAAVADTLNRMGFGHPMQGLHTESPTEPPTDPAMAVLENVE